jgi:hypothetical protein
MNTTDPVTTVPVTTRVEVTDWNVWYDQGDRYSYGPAQPQYVEARLVESRPTGDVTRAGMLWLHGDTVTFRSDGVLYSAPANLIADEVRELFGRVEEYRRWEENPGLLAAPCRCWPADAHCARCLADEVDHHVSQVELAQKEAMARFEQAREAIATLMERVVEDHPEHRALAGRVADAVFAASATRLRAALRASSRWAEERSDQDPDTIDWFGAERIRVVLAAMAAA